MTKNTETTAVATTSEKAAPAAPVGFDASGFKVTKDVVLPILQLPVGVARGVEILGPLFEGKEIKQNGQAAKKPATLANVINLQSGERAQIVVPAVLEANLREAYPQDAYVGKMFLVQNEGKREGKAYNDFKIAEIERE